MQKYSCALLSLAGMFSFSVWLFLQGMTIKPLVELLEVKRKKRALPTVSAEIHGRVRNV